MSKTGVNGILLNEAKYINLSLHYLEQVGSMTCLCQVGGHVARRDCVMMSM